MHCTSICNMPRPVKSHALCVWHMHLAYFTCSHAKSSRSPTSGVKYETTPKNGHATPSLGCKQCFYSLYCESVIAIASRYGLPKLMTLNVLQSYFILGMIKLLMVLGQYYHSVAIINAPINILCPTTPCMGKGGADRGFDFSNNKCPPTGAIFSNQNASIKIAKLISFSVFRRFSDLYQRFMKIKNPDHS